MAMYYCHHCGNYIDDDWNPGEEDPVYLNELICPDCLETYEEEEAENGEHDNPGLGGRQPDPIDNLVCGGTGE